MKRNIDRSLRWGIAACLILSCSGCANVRKAADKMRRGSELRQIGIAIHAYAGDKGVFPSEDEAIAACLKDIPDSAKKVRDGEYGILWKNLKRDPKTDDAVSEEIVIAYDNRVRLERNPAEGHPVLFLSGKVKNMTPAEFEAATGLAPLPPKQPAYSLYLVLASFAALLLLFVAGWYGFRVWNKHRRAAVTGFLLLAIAFGSSGCAKKKEPQANPPAGDVQGGIKKHAPIVGRHEVIADLKQFCVFYKSYQDEHGKPPVKLDDLPDIKNSMKRCHEAIVEGRYVVLWGAAGEGILAYEKDAPTQGGVVLTSDGAARLMTADEFARTPKAK